MRNVWDNQSYHNGSVANRCEIDLPRILVSHIPTTVLDGELDAPGNTRCFNWHISLNNWNSSTPMWTIVMSCEFRKFTRAMRDRLHKYSFVGKSLVVDFNEDGSTRVEWSVVNDVSVRHPDRASIIMAWGGLMLLDTLLFPYARLQQRHLQPQQANDLATTIHDQIRQSTFAGDVDERIGRDVEQTLKML